MRQLINSIRKIKKIYTLKRDYRSTKQTIFDVFDEKQSIFIHIPKTAGISVVRSLYGDNFGWGHYTWKQVQQVLGEEKFSNYFKFSFVRHPLDRLFSAYNYLQEGGRSNIDKKFNKQVLSKYKDFEDFVLNGLHKTSVQEMIHFIPQTKFIYDKRDMQKVDFIGQFENLIIDYDLLRERIGGEKLSWLNKKRDIFNFESEYSVKMKNVVFKIYERDFRLLEY